MDNSIEIMVNQNSSPSTRRAWIEIRKKRMRRHGSSVALHTEGVDRNAKVLAGKQFEYPSPSTRRAWIEMIRAPA